MSARYLVYGEELNSELPFPELDSATGDGEPRWSIRVSDAEPPGKAGEELGARPVVDGWVLRLATRREGYRLTFGATGVYDVDLRTSPRTLTWYRADDADEDLVRSVILGPGLGLMLHHDGVLCLHGSAVSLAGEAIGFIAPKHHGKSTLALALVRRGAKLLSDDLLAIEPGTPSLIRPGVQQPRLLPDAVRALGPHPPGSVGGGSKPSIRLAASQRQPGSVPLRALYALEPRSDPPYGAEGPASRHRLRGSAALFALTANRKLEDPLIGASRSGDELRRAAATAFGVEIYRLRFTHDYARLVEVARDLWGWHRRPPLGRDCSAPRPLARRTTQEALRVR